MANENELRAIQEEISNENLPWEASGTFLTALPEDADPTEKALGPGIWTALQNRFYIDALYRQYMVQPAEKFAAIMVQAVDKETIDGILDTIGEMATGTGEFFKRFNTVVIDGVGDGIPRAIARGAREFREIQSGRIQQYLLYVVIALLVISTLLLYQAR